MTSSNTNPTEIETLQKRVRDQRQELGRLQKFHDDHQRGIRAPLGGFVKADPLRESIRELISRRAREQEKLEHLGADWWVLQHQINGLKSAYGQIDATIAGLEAKPKGKRKAKQGHGELTYDGPDEPIDEGYTFDPAELQRQARGE